MKLFQQKTGEGEDGLAGGGSTGSGGTGSGGTQVGFGGRTILGLGDGKRAGELEEQEALLV